jgi:acyl dehydratase
MRAIHAAGIPNTLASYVTMLARPRRGLTPGMDMPRIERSAGPCVIERAWLDAYRDSVGLPVGPSLPPLALQLAASPLHLSILADERFPYKAFGLLHVSQRVDQPAAIPTDASMTLDAFTEPAAPSPRGARFRLVTEARVDGKLVQRAETLALAPSGKPSGDRPAREEEAPLGTPRLAAELDVPENIGRRYAAIAGDFNPIHQHALLAKPFGFKRAIVHGTWTVARAIHMAGLPTSESFDLYMRFRKPVSLPSRLTVSAYREDGLDRVRVATRDGKTVHTDIEVRSR